MDERLQRPVALAHEGREDGRHSPEAVLGFYTASLRYHPEDLQRAFFSVRFSRVLDALGYAPLLHWRVLGHEWLAKRDVALWLGGALSRYEVEYQPGSGAMAGKKLIQVRHPELFETAYLLPQPRLFGLEEVLGDGWLKALRLDGYAPRRSREPQPVSRRCSPTAKHTRGCHGLAPRIPIA